MSEDRAMSQVAPATVREAELHLRLLGERDDEGRPYHLRRIAMLLLSVDPEDRTDVQLGAGRMVNCGGGRYSDAVDSEVRAWHLDRLSWKARRELDRADDRRVSELERAWVGAGLIDLDRVGL